MPRLRRIVLPGHPHHIMQRGHDRNAVFTSKSDYLYYLDTLVKYKDIFAVQVYAFCLMATHVHLLVIPSDNKGLGLLMKRLAGRQTRYRNKLENRSGTLWEGRYKASIVDAETYLLSCVRYIELNPIRSRIVAEPSDYPWSSYAGRIRTGVYEWLDGLPSVHTGSTDHTEHTSRYESYIKSSIPDGEWEFIQTAVNRNQLTGGNRFVEEVDRIVGRRIEYRGQGRPAKADRL